MTDRPAGRPLPLRWLLLAPIACILVVGVVALGLYVERGVRTDLLARVDDELTRAIAAEAGRFDGRAPAPRPDGGAEATDGPENPTLFLLSPEGEVLAQTPNAGDLTEAELAPLVAAAAGATTIDGDPRYRVLTRPVRDGQIGVAAFPLDQLDASVASLRRNLLVGGLGLLAAQAIAVWLIAARVARPVTDLSDAAHRIAAGELGTSIGPAGRRPRGSREIVALTGDLDRMLDRLRVTIAERERAATEAQQAADDMSRFLADASHELRTPLTAVKGYSDLYASGMLAEQDLDRAMQRIGNESDRLHQLVVDLLDLVRRPDVRESVDPAAVVEAVADDLRAANPDRAITVDGPDRGTLAVIGDPHRLHQAVLNLGANAGHHTPAGSPVSFVITVDGPADGLPGGDGTVEIRVVDRGPGIDPADAEGLFLPFRRGDRSRSRRGAGGAGLGLALTRQIAEQHGGTVHVEPTDGGGATFILALPAGRVVES
ncbi:MAG: HAMP domain-containing sensor histidine kinase [Actinomycetota bacterium]